MKLDPTIITALCKTIETSIRWALQYDPGSQAAMAKMEGKVLAVSSTQPELCLYFVCHATYLQVLSYYEETPDCKIEGSMSCLIELLWSEQDSLANSGVVLSGEIGFLLQLKKLISQLNIDWEEPITDALGDTLGHTLAELMRNKFQWLQARATTFPLWVGETLTEELQASPAKTELENFYRDVDSLRSSTDRLQAHINMLKHSLTKKS